MDKIVLVQMSESVYISSQGLIMQREFGKTPNGNDLSGKWVLRDAENKIIDFGQYRHDLAERQNLDLIHEGDKS